MRFLTRAAALATTAVLLAACTFGTTDKQAATGETTTASATDSATPSGTATESATPEQLTVEQLHRALLGRSYLVGHFTTETDMESAFHTAYRDKSVSLGCLRALDTVDFGVAEGEAARFDARAKNDAESPSVIEVLGPAEEHRINAGFRELGLLLRSCRKLDNTHKGVRLVGRVKVDRDAATGAVSRQVNITMTGQLRILHSRFPLGLWTSVIALDGHVALVSVLNLSHADGDAQQRLARMATSRLAAVIDGRPTPDPVLVRLTHLRD